jgi:hypothetical protein
MWVRSCSKATRSRRDDHVGVVRWRDSSVQHGVMDGDDDNSQQGNKNEQAEHNRVRGGHMVSSLLWQVLCGAI